MKKILMGVVCAIATCTGAWSTVVFASDWTCTTPYYPTEPVMDGNHVFHLLIQSVCQSSTRAPKLDTLAKEFSPRAADGVVVHSGPTSEEFDGMLSSAYDVSEACDSGHGDVVTIRSDVHVATDSSKRFHFKQISKSIQATGDSKYLRQFDKEITLESSKGDVTNFVYGHTISIAKPTLVPAAIFISEVKKEVGKGFIDDREVITRKISEAGRE